MTRDISQNQGMLFQKFLVPVGSLLLVLAAYYFYRWAGVAVAVSALVLWLLLHFSRMMQVLKRTTDRPIGYVGSAVMLHAKLQPGMTLLHVVAMTRALGTRLTEKDVQPEVFRWTDGTDSHVTCTFVGGKLAQHALFRPTGDALSPAP